MLLLVFIYAQNWSSIQAYCNVVRNPQEWTISLPFVTFESELFTNENWWENIAISIWNESEETINQIIIKLNYLKSE